MAGEVLVLVGCGFRHYHGRYRAFSSQKPVKPLSTLQEQEHALMIGKWYDEATTIAGKGMQQLIERRADGIFTVNFRVTVSVQPPHPCSVCGAEG